jgi:hypothetical protein
MLDKPNKTIITAKNIVLLGQDIHCLIRSNTTSIIGKKSKLGYRVKNKAPVINVQSHIITFDFSLIAKISKYIEMTAKRVAVASDIALDVWVICWGLIKTNELERSAIFSLLTVFIIKNVRGIAKLPTIVEINNAENSMSPINNELIATITG